MIADGATLPFASGSFDFVTAFMSLMDVGDPESTLREMQRVLKPDGFVQFSVVHPATATPIRRWVDDASGRREALAIGNYFFEGPITERWTFGAAPAEIRERHEPFTVTYARRTLTGWVNAVLAAGLSIEAIAEPHADEETARDHPEVADTRIVPYFLILPRSQAARVELVVSRRSSVGLTGRTALTRARRLVHDSRQTDGTADECCSQRRDEHAELRLVGMNALAEREVGDEERHGEADSRERSCADHIPFGHRVRQSADPEADGEQGGDRDPDRLAEHESEDHTPCRPVAT